MGCWTGVDAKLKHTRSGTHQKPIELLSYSDKDLCVVHHLEEYIRRIATIRKDKSQLLISYIKPHNPVSKDTIARWVEGVLKDADINTNNYSSHSSRAAATSYGFAKGVKLTEILQAAGWSNCSNVCIVLSQTNRERHAGKPYYASISG